MEFYGSGWGWGKSMRVMGVDLRYRKWWSVRGMKKLVHVLCGVVVSISCLVLWLCLAMDYGDAVAAGTYRFKRVAESSTLVLNLDHTFRQTRTVGSIETHSDGTWRREGEGGVSFSKEFLVISGDEPEPDGTTFSEMHKFLGLFPYLCLRQYHVLWYGKGGSDNLLTGTYSGDEPGVAAALILSSDHSFSQTVAHGAIANHAEGTWSQDSDGTVRFSRAFLKSSGEPLGANEIASSTDPRGSNLQIEVSLTPNIPEPVFRKRLVNW
jgi:hypothetical protein